MKGIPELYKDLRDPYDLDQFVSDVIDTIIENESEEEEGKRAFTYAELRDLLEAHYDKAYDPEHRHLERKPTQREVNFVIEAMLSETDWNNQVIREKDGLIYSISEAEREATDDANHNSGYKLDRARVG
jgi:hypothetical protein